MSIKILAGKDRSGIIPFLLISFLLHIGMLLALPHTGLHTKSLPRLIPVDVIVLPQPPQLKEKVRKGDEIKKQPPIIDERELVNEEVKPTHFLPSKEEVIPKGITPSQQKEEKPAQTDSTSPKEQVQKKPPPTLEKSGDTQNDSSPSLPLKGEKPLALFPTEEKIAQLSKKYEKEMFELEKQKEAGENKTRSLVTTRPDGRQYSLFLNQNFNVLTNEPIHFSYLQSLKSKIYGKWEYPRTAFHEGQMGRLFVRFSLRKDGQLADIDLIKSSGYPMLDDAALTAVRLAAPFYPFPKDAVETEKLVVTAMFEYIIVYKNYTPAR